MEYVTLSNGIEMPKLGFGVFQIPEEETKQAVLDAIDSGYRMIDTAQAYQNEVQVGEAIKETIIPREELFITTKVWIDQYGYENTLASVKLSMEKLGLDYLDLILLHQPFSDYYGSYRALVELYKEGKVKAIGVSNFYPDRLTDIVHFSEMAPHVNQVETNIYNQQIDANENMTRHGVVQQAWSPFAGGQNNIFEHETLKAIGDKHNKSVSQVILRWLAQRDIVALAKSVNPDRMKQNLDIFDFELTNEDMELIAALDEKTSQFFSHQDPKMVDYFASRG